MPGTLCCYGLTAWYEDGVFYMLYRAAGDDPTHPIFLGLATSTDGFHFERVSDEPVLSPRDNGPDGGCIEDLRIVKFGGHLLHYLRLSPIPTRPVLEASVGAGLPAEQFARKIMDEADRLTAISDDLLDLARIEANRPLRMEEFALLEVVQSVVSDLQAKADQKAIEVSVGAPDGLLIAADRDAVYQILVNLVDNAIRYTRPGGSVSISAESNEAGVSISVADTGIGIPEDEQARIFERFYRVDKGRSRESGGTGLGLSIVKHLVEAHGGKIIVESTPGEGSKFEIRIPSRLSDGIPPAAGKSETNLK